MPTALLNASAAREKITAGSLYIKPGFWVIIYQAAGMVIGKLTRTDIDGWYQLLHKSPLTPPHYIFPAIWTILYVLIALAGWRVWEARSQPGMRAVFAVFLLYTVLNWGWSLVFFNLHMIQIALLWLLLMNVLSLVFMGLCWASERRAALLMAVPTLWTLFAGYLNYALWVLN